MVICFCFYLAGPNPGDQIAVVPEYVEYFQDSSGVAEHRDAGIRDGEIQREEVRWLKRGPLPVQDKYHQTVSKP